jgi:plasmid stabilization system protein ParE
MKIVWGERARLEFESAVAHLQTQSPSAAKRVGEQILAAIGMLERFPELAPTSKHRGLRQLVASRTPYLVIYRIHADRVEIRAVIHAKQRRRR